MVHQQYVLINAQKCLLEQIITNVKHHVLVQDVKVIVVMIYTQFNSQLDKDKIIFIVLINVITLQLHK